MRVGLLAYNARAQDAVGNHLAATLAFLAERGAEVRLFVQCGQRLHPAVRAATQIVDHVQSAGSAWDYLASCDVVLAHYPHWHELLHFLPLLAHAKVRLVLDYHGVTPAHFWHGTQRDVMQDSATKRGIVWCADAALVHSQFAHEELGEATDYPGDRLFQLGCPVDAAFSPSKPKISLNQRLGLKPEVRLLLFVGRLAPNKRVPLLVEALGQLRDEQPPIHLAVVGDDGDVYAEQKERCLDLGWQHGVRDRVHFLGQIPLPDLVDAYRSATLLVMPSVHEGFCLPVVEAMACGLPVLAARAGALPETVGDAGFTFAADDAAALARQVRRLMAHPESTTASPPTQSVKKRIALVAFRFGSGIVGGAERSLRTMALALQGTGHQVEIYTTCTRSESDWRNELPAGTNVEVGLTIHRFPLDPHDRAAHLRTLEALRVPNGTAHPELAADYLRHSVHSSALIEALVRRADSLDAIITGPYLFGLTHDVATRFPAKTLIAPCFHDEPLAHLSVWPEAYGSVGGLLFHSPEEQDFAQTVLGVNHPNAWCVGTWLEMASQPDMAKDRAPRSLVYCGRYSPEKNVPLLLEWFARYQETRAGRFKLVCLGGGGVALPRKPWLQDLGWVTEERKREVLAGAAALVQLSTQESLSLAALEAWAQGTPLVAHEASAVLAGQVLRSQGGRTVVSYEDFAEILDDLWEQPETWRALGENGRRYVQENYADAQAFTNKLEAALQGLTITPTEQGHRRGLEKANRYSPDAWRTRLGQVLDEILEAPARDRLGRAQIQPWQAAYGANPQQRSLLLPVRVENVGGGALLPDGPARTLLFSQVVRPGTNPLPESMSCAALPGLLIPGQTAAAVVPVDVPRAVGAYEVKLWAGPENAETTVPPDAATIILQVRDTADAARAGGLAPLLDAAHATLAQAHNVERLPDGYQDVTQGWFAGIKRWLKRKLLGNFQHAYVDVLSRQQTQVNRHLVVCVQQLAEACGALDHALTTLHSRLDGLESRAKQKEAADSVELDENNPRVSQLSEEDYPRFPGASS